MGRGAGGVRKMCVCVYEYTETALTYYGQPVRRSLLPAFGVASYGTALPPLVAARSFTPGPMANK